MVSAIFVKHQISSETKARVDQVFNKAGIMAELYALLVYKKYW